MSFPLVYDIAVFIAEKLKTDHQLQLNADEITFIALHIGSWFENNSINDICVRCAFIYSDYYNIQQNTLDKIAARFDDQLVIARQCSFNDFDASGIGNYDLIISTVPAVYQAPYICIPLFLRNADWKHLLDMISKIHHKKKMTILKSYLLTFIDQKIFFSGVHYSNREEAIRSMADNLIANGYVNSDFCEEVLQREAMASTAFNHVSHPHALSMNNTQKALSQSPYRTSRCNGEPPISQSSA